MDMKKIYKAAMDKDSLRNLLQEDPNCLANYIARVEDGGRGKISPLQIACNLGHLAFVSEMASTHPGLVISERDRRGRSLLHLASAKGQEELVRLLLGVDSNLCLVQDVDGMTALHVAAMKGHTELLPILVGANPFTTQILTDTGETVLHICVRYNRLKALEVLLQTLSATDILQRRQYCVNKLRDEEDNTILHLATAMRNVEIIRFLLEERGMVRMQESDVNAMNAEGQTAMDVLLAIPSKLDDVKVDMEIKEVLVKHEGMRGRDYKQRTENSTSTNTGNHVISSGSITAGSSGTGGQKTMAKHSETLSDIRSALLVVGVLLLTLTFTVGVTPPGGLWQEDDDKSKPPAHVAGKAIIGYTSRLFYAFFVGVNTAGFFASIYVVWNVLAGWSDLFPYFSRAIFVSVNVALCALGVAYGFGVAAVSRYESSVVLLAVGLVWLLFETPTGRKFGDHLARRYPSMTSIPN